MVQISKMMKIILIVTVALFAVSIVCLGVSLAVELIGGGDAYVAFGDGGGKQNTPEPSTPAGSVTSGVGTKTGIVLPCATKEGTYLGAKNERTQDVSGDTDIKSAATVLVDITDNVVVAGKNADTKIYPASMTKVMTLLVACENAKDPNARLTLTKEMTDKYKSPTNKGASLAFEWQEGYSITVEDALHMIIYGSDTYACWLIADYVAGSEEAFVAMMNQKAAAIGISSSTTNFTNCTGLYNKNHYTTCRDMAAVMAAAMNNETATSVLSRYEEYLVDVYYTGDDGKETSEAKGMWAAWCVSRFEKYCYANTRWYYAGKGSDIEFVGGKTGWETIPTSCFVTAGIDDVTGRRYVCVQVGRIDDKQTEIDSETSTYDTREMYWKYAKEPE